MDDLLVWAEEDLKKKIAQEKAANRGRELSSRVIPKAEIWAIRLFLHGAISAVIAAAFFGIYCFTVTFDPENSSTFCLGLSGFALLFWNVLIVPVIVENRISDFDA